MSCSRVVCSELQLAQGYRDEMWDNVPTPAHLDGGHFTVIPSPPAVLTPTPAMGNHTFYGTHIETGCRAHSPALGSPPGPLAWLRVPRTRPPMLSSHAGAAPPLLARSALLVLDTSSTPPEHPARTPSSRAGTACRRRQGSTCLDPRWCAAARAGCASGRGWWCHTSGTCNVPQSSHSAPRCP